MVVHPRTRGEHLTAYAQALNLTGSSPHTRGTQRHGELVGGRHRFIPAHAGNTPP